MVLNYLYETIKKWCKENGNKEKPYDKLVSLEILIDDQVHESQNDFVINGNFIPNNLIYAFNESRKWIYIFYGYESHIEGSNSGAKTIELQLDQMYATVEQIDAKALSEKEISKLKTYIESPNYQTYQKYENYFEKWYDAGHYINKSFSNDLIGAIKFFNELPGLQIPLSIIPENSLKQMIYEFVENINNSDTFTAQSDDDLIIISSINSKSDHFKIPLIKIENNNNEFKFIVDLTNKNGEVFNIRTIIKSEENFKQVLQSTVDSLNNYSEFESYIEDFKDILYHYV